MRKRLAVITGSGAFKKGHFSRVQALLDYLSRTAQQDSWLKEYDMTLLVERPNEGSEWDFDDTFPAEFDVQYFGVSVGENARGKTLLKGASTISGIKSMIRETYDVSISSMMQGGLLAAIGRQIGRIGISIYDDMDYYPNFIQKHHVRRVVGQVEKIIIRSADYVSSVSNQLGQIRKKQGARNVIVVPNGANVQMFDEAYEANKKKEIDTLVLLYSGSLDPSIWGLDIILQAVKEVSGVKEVTLRVVGGGPFMSRLENYAKKLDICDSVEFIGAVDHSELPRYFQGAHAGFAIGIPGSPADEADPIKIKEYLAAGIPFIGTDIPNSRQIYNDTRFGVLCQPSVSSVVEAILTLSRRYEVLVQSAEKTRSYMEERYSWDAVFDYLFASTINKKTGIRK